MTCRNCGAEIADKALICYRCGTATTEAKYKPAAVRAKSSKRGPILAVILLLIVLLALLAYFYFRATPLPSAHVSSHQEIAALYQAFTDCV
jgi:uncharacterized membrane protein YvbJ